MKKVCILALSVLFFVSCSKKDDDVDPDLASQVAGSYEVTYMEFSGESFDLSQPNVSAEVVFSKVGNETAELLLSAKVDTETFETGERLF